MKNLLHTLSILIVLALSADVLWAQEGADALAKKAQNPIANMISVPLQNNTSFGIGTFGRVQNVLNVQPVIPSGLGKWNLINRLIIPITSQPNITQEDGGEFGLGDIVYQGFFTPSGKGKVTWGIGPVLIAPTATHQNLGSGKWSAGPAAIVVAFINKWVIGGVVYNAFSFAGQSDRADVNAGVLQYFVNYNLQKAWYITSSPIISVNWKATDNNKLILPFGAGVGKIFGIGKQKFNGQVSAYWNAVKPEAVNGPDWSLRAQLVFLFPK